jgi:hypothetical protein
LYGSAAKKKKSAIPTSLPSASDLRGEERDPAAGQAAGDSPRPLRRTRRHVLLSAQYFFFMEKIHRYDEFSLGSACFQFELLLPRASRYFSVRGKERSRERNCIPQSDRGFA